MQLSHGLVELVITIKKPIEQAEYILEADPETVRDAQEVHKLELKKKILELSAKESGKEHHFM